MDNDNKSIMSVLSGGLLSLVVLVGCGSRQPLVPKYDDARAKEMLDEETLVLLGTVRRVEEPIPQTSGFGQVRVSLHVLRVLKGQYNSKSACFVYLISVVGYVGPRVTKVMEGDTGVFALVPGDRCFRAVRDNKAIFLSYKLPQDFSRPLDEVVAEATLPVFACAAGRIYPSEAEHDSLMITRSLIGNRPTLKLLRDALDSPDPRVRSCTCIVLVRKWMQNESCLDSLPEGSLDPSEVDQIRVDFRKKWELVRKRFEADPLRWLQGDGLDSTLEVLSGLSLLPGFRITPETCRMFKDNLETRKTQLALAQTREVWPDAEREALSQFKTWLDRGCPMNYEPFKHPDPSNTNRP